ncbi:MAG: HAD hydrolase-like protein [Zetaproteobacteria bacterium]|nr:HAD hydrolase-like protein [Zetaproteobacteria bacterium]
MNLIFDFDGTLCESGPLTYDHLKHLNPDLPSWEEMRRYSSEEVVRLIGLGPIPLFLALFRARREFRRSSGKINVVPGVKDAVSLLSKRHQLFVCSSNSYKNIESYLRRHDMLHYFQHILSVPTVFGKKKHLRRWIDKSGLNLSDCVYVGDETRDVVASQAIGLPVCAVAWGFNHQDTLGQLRPNFLALCPGDLVKLFT